MNAEWPTSTSPFKDNAPEGSVGIFMLVRGRLKFVQLAYYAIQYFTDHPYTVCFVNNQSDLKTRNTVQGISVNHGLWMVHDHRDLSRGALVNVGFKQLFKFPNVKYGAIVACDVVVGPEWLSKLVGHLNRFVECGVVSPRMNKLPEKSFGSVTGACMVFHRGVFEQLGGFNENMSDGEDFEFCERVEKLGLTCDTAGGVAVHRFGLLPRAEQESAVKSSGSLSLKGDKNEQRIKVG